MKKSLLALGLISSILFPQLGWTDGPAEPIAPASRKAHRTARVKEEAPPPAPPACIPKSEASKVKLLSWDPKQKVSKFLGVIQECVTTQWDVLRMLSGPNAIGLRYPEEREMWSYLWLWRYDLANPMQDTIISMDKPGKRVLKGKNPVELYITFNEQDVVERVELDLIKKKDSQYKTP